MSELRLRNILGMGKTAAGAYVPLKVDADGKLQTSGGGGSGDVTGPASSTDNAITRFDGTGGKTIQNSSATIDDNGTVNIPAGQEYQINGTALSASDVGALSSTVAEVINLPVLNGKGFALTTGTKELMFTVPYACTITAAGFVTDQSTTTTIDIWKSTYDNFPPDNGDSITASAPLSSSEAIKARDTTLTGWTTSLAKGDIIYINIDANDNAQLLCVFLEVTRA